MNAVFHFPGENFSPIPVIFPLINAVFHFPMENSSLVGLPMVIYCIFVVSVKSKICFKTVSMVSLSNYANISETRWCSLAQFLLV